MNFMQTVSPTRFSRYVARYAAALAATAMLLLTGCASTLRSDVTSFQRWPANVAGSTYSFKRLGNQATSLEHSTYEDLARIELNKLGLKEAAMPAGTPTPANGIAIARGRFEVTLDYGINSRTLVSQEPVLDSYPSYWRQPYWSPVHGWRPGYWVHDPFGPRVVGYHAVSRNISTRQLRVEIVEGTTKLFEASATSSGATNSLPVVMPYLVRSVFDGFPGANGQARSIDFDVEKGDIKNRLVRQPG